MFNSKTHLVNILKSVVGGIVALQLLGCGKSSDFNKKSVEQSKIYRSQITGGKKLDPLSPLGKKIIYLALGVQKQIAPGDINGGMNISMNDQCTAVAISANVLLTAGHCLAHYQPQEVYAVLGGDPWKNAYKENNWLEVEKIVVHENYRNDEAMAISENDLALIKLKKPLTADYVLPLASSADIQKIMASKSKLLRILEIGYGIHELELSKDTDDTEQSVNYAIKTLDEDQLQHEKIEIDQHDGAGFCMGDSGSPGLITSENQLKVLAIASHVKTTRADRENSANQLEQPCRGLGVYTNLLSQQDWLRRTLSGL